MTSTERLLLLWGGAAGLSAVAGYYLSGKRALGAAAGAAAPVALFYGFFRATGHR